MTYKTGLEDCYVIKNNKKMRLGYTTGSCAAAAASGAAQILLGGKTITEVSLMTPKGILLHLKLEDITVKDNLARYPAVCAKMQGDDPDTTDGILVVCHCGKDVRTESARIQIWTAVQECWQSNQSPDLSQQAGRSGHQSGSPMP